MLLACGGGGDGNGDDNHAWLMFSRGGLDIGDDDYMVASLDTDAFKRDDELINNNLQAALITDIGLAKYMDGV